MRRLPTRAAVRYHLSLLRAGVRYYARHRRWAALLRSTFRTIVLLEHTEQCQVCGRGVGLAWSAPEPLWTELVGGYGGLLCPRCFDRTASDAGIRLRWTPVVVRSGGVATTNHWADPVRDRLLVGEPDPGFHPEGKVRVPQGHWGEIGRMLGWGYESPYPDENRAESVAGRSGER